MERKIINELVAWKNRINHKPLILNGARQIGKTYILKEFGVKHYSNFVHADFSAISRNVRMN